MGRALVASLALNLGLVALAGALSERPRPEHLSGRIVSISSNAIVVLTGDGIKAGALAVTDSVHPRPRRDDVVRITHFTDPDVIVVTESVASIRVTRR